MADNKPNGGSQEPVLHVSLLWFGPIILRRSEVWGFLRHPLMLFFFVILFAIIVIANNSPESVKVPFGLRAAVYGFSPLVATALVMLWIEFRARTAAVSPVRINLALVVLVSVLCVVPLSDSLQRRYFEPEIFSWPRLFAKVLFYGSIAEIMLACAIVFFGEGVLKELRERAAAKRAVPVKTLPDQVAPVLRFRLFGLKPVDATYRDFLVGLLHPKAQIVLVLFFVAVLAGNSTSDAAETQVALRTAFYFFSVVLGWATWAGVVGLWRAFGQRVNGVIDLPTSLTMFISTVLITPLADYYDRLWITPETFDWARLMARLIFYLTLSHVSSALVMALVAEDILGDVRARRARRAEQAPSPVPQPIKRNVTVGGMSFDSNRLLMLQARRNVVEVVLRDTVLRVPGPLAERVAELPADMGRMVHRSVWVVEARITGHRRDGREIALDIEGGHSVNVALSRQAELLPWLRELAEQRA